jgi:hypothetical protein
MPLFRRIPHHITCAIFAALWSAVLIARVGAVDPRVISGHPVAAAHRIERRYSDKKTKEPLDRCSQNVARTKKISLFQL